MAATVSIAERNASGAVDITGIRYRSSAAYSTTTPADTAAPLTAPGSYWHTANLWPANAWSYLKYHQLHITVPPDGQISNVVVYTDVGGSGTNRSQWGSGAIVYFNDAAQTYAAPVQAAFDSVPAESAAGQMTGYTNVAFAYYDINHTLSLRVADYNTAYSYMPECLVSYMCLTGAAPVPGFIGRHTIYFAWDET